MPGSIYERLSALDASFLSLEAPNAHMHVAVTAILGPGPLSMPEDGIDFESLRNHVESALEQIPRYRQRLMYLPLLRHPVWVDDDAFSLTYHVRHAAPPRPGSLRQLKRLIGVIMSQKLDRSKPLWEIWVVEGPERGRFALITKAHHTMFDGISGVDMLKVLLSPSPGGGLRESGEGCQQRVGRYMSTGRPGAAAAATPRSMSRAATDTFLWAHCHGRT